MCIVFNWGCIFSHIERDIQRPVIDAIILDLISCLEVFVAGNMRVRVDETVIEPNRRTGTIGPPVIGVIGVVAFRKSGGLSAESQHCQAIIDEV
jgi:hypothetical protein